MRTDPPQTPPQTATINPALNWDTSRPQINMEETVAVGVAMVGLGVSRSLEMLELLFQVGVVGDVFGGILLSLPPPISESSRSPVSTSANKLITDDAPSE